MLAAALEALCSGGSVNSSDGGSASKSSSSKTRRTTKTTTENNNADAAAVAVATTTTTLLLPRWVLPSLLAFAVFVRVAVSTHGYSGEGTPPMYGDYEAQRHWMEITLHAPLSSWYVHTADNDLKYWGLDYPPLTAYQSYLYGAVIAAVEPEAVALVREGGAGGNVHAFVRFIPSIKQSIK